MKKIAIIGAGNIGGVLAYLASVRELGEITLVDLKEGIAKGKALDICQSSSIYGFNPLFSCTTTIPGSLL